MTCPSDEALKRLASGALTAGERQGVEEHLSRCPGCRGRAVEMHLVELGDPGEERPLPAALRQRVERLASGASSARLGRAGRVAAAAAVLALVGLAGLWLARTGAPPPGGDPVPLRATPPAASAPRLEAPAAGAELVSAGALTFRWSAVAGARDYRVTVLDSRGDLLIEAESFETSLTMPAETLAAGYPGDRYWLVTVRFDDGTEADSEIRRLRR